MQVAGGARCTRCQLERVAPATGTDKSAISAASGTGET